ncbi:MAG TPA: YraN family protein [Parasegetibacter sp.]|jgi:putative endonuclease
MAVHNDFGKKGESMACEYLKARGYSILHRNWRYRKWEVDIIASKEGVLHIVEVKTRQDTVFGFPEAAVSRQKIIHMMTVAEVFMNKYRHWKRVQFDILSIVAGNNTDIFLIEDVSV